MNKRILSTILVFTLPLILGACEALNSSEMDDGSLNGSGTITAREVGIAPELGGVVMEVLVEEGKYVEKDDILFLMDDEMLQTYRNQAAAAVAVAEAALLTAEANLHSARLQYDLVLNAAHTEALPYREQAWRHNLPRVFTLPVWYFEKEDEIDSLQEEVSAAEEVLEREQQNLERVLQDASTDDLMAAEKRLSDARAAYLVAEDVLDQARRADDRTEIRDFAETQFEAAETELEAAQSAYDRMLSDAAADDVVEARARVAVAKARYDTALTRLNILRIGEDSFQVKVAAAGVAQAEAAVVQAQAAVAHAQAALATLDTQLEKTVIRAPSSGVVLTRNLEPGETVSPGGVVLVIAYLDEVKLTVYVSEDQYGKVNLGQKVEIIVDSFPGERFIGTVVKIAEEAEFTPRNVQTVDGRRSTVYGVEIRVPNTEMKLKPGMPADARFLVAP